MKDLLIFGATSLARQAHYYAVNDMGFNVLGFVVDSAYKSEDILLSLPVLTWEQAYETYTINEVCFFVAIGYKNMRLKAASYTKIKFAGYQLVNIISRASFVANNVLKGDSNMIMPNVVIEPNVVIGSNNTIWSNTTICHDCTIGNHNFIAANTTIGGEVCIGEQNFFGFSTTVLQQTLIGNSTLIGAQSLITKNTTDFTKYHGTPAKKIALIDSNVGVVV